MKKIFTLFMMFMFMAVTSIFAEEKTSTWTMNTADGIAEITVTKQGAPDTGGDLELTKDGITATSALGYFKGSGSNGIQIYKTGTLTITAPTNGVIKSIVFQYPKDCYPFAEAVNEGGSSTTKTPAQVDVTFTAATPANSFTFTNVAGGQTKVKKMVVTYEVSSTDDTKPFSFTAVTNNEVAGTVDGAEASEQGVSYQFNATATGKALSKGTATPTLTLMEDASVDFGAASILATEGETAYIRFMAKQQYFFTQPGTYVLTIPEGTLVDADGNPNAATTLKWVVAQGGEKTPFDITAITMNWKGETIAAGAEVEALSYSYAIDTDKTIAAGEGHIEFKDANGNGIGVASLNAEAKTINFYNFGENGYTTPGTYTLTIPAGAIVDADGNPCNEFTATWTVKEQAEKTPFNITAVTMNWMGEAIEAGAEVEALSYMYNLTAEKEGLVAGEGHIEFKDANGIGIGVGSWNGYYLSFTNFGQEGYKTPGTYTLTIPAGALVDANGNPCNEFTATWTVKEQSEKTPFDITAVTMNWKGETIAAGAEVEALSYSYAIDTDKTIAAGEGHIEFKDANGNGIGVASLLAEAKTINFYNFGENGYTTPGTYTLTIPAGAIVDANGNPCNEFTATWTVKEQVPVSTFAITAATNGGNEAGAEVEAISYMFTITAANAIKGLHEGNITLTDANNQPVGGNAIVVGYEGEEGSTTVYARFAFDTEDHNLHTAGTYTLNVPAGMFVDAEGNLSEAYTASWTIKEQAPVSTFAITAATNGGNEAGAEVEAISYMFAITAANAIKGLHEGNITLTDANNQPVGGNAIVVGYEGEEGSTTVYARFAFDTEDHNLHTAGTYTLNVPAGMFVDAEGNLSEAYTASWTIKEQAPVGTFAITAATNAGNEAGAEVEAISYMFTITAANAIKGLHEGNITLTDANNQPVGGNAIVVGYEGEEGSTTVYARFAFDTEDHNLHTAGIYTLNVPAGMFVDAEGNLSEAYTASWTIKGAEPQVETTNLDATLFHTWDGFGADAQVVSETCYWDAVELGTVLGGGSVVYGSGNVTNTDYANISEYSTLVIEGTAGTPLRLMFNRQADNSLIEKNPAIGEDGKLVFDIEEFVAENGYCHLNAIKTAWGGIPENAVITALYLTKSVVAAPFAITGATNAGNEPGTEVDALSYMFEITAANAITGLHEGHITLTDANDQPVGGYAIVQGYEGEGGATTVYARFAFDSEDHMLHTAGTYTLNVPAGMFADAKGNLNEAYTASWTVKEQAPAGSFAITSVQNGQNESSDVEVLSYMFSITAANAITGVHEGSITLTDADGQPVGGNAYVYGYEGEGGATTVFARFTFDSDDHMLHTPGTYTLNIPAGMFVDAEGNLSEAYTATWNVTGSELDKTAAENTIADLKTLLEDNKDILSDAYNTFSNRLSELENDLDAATTQSEVDNIAYELNQLYGDIQNAINEITGIETVTLATKANGKYIKNGKIIIVKNGKLFNVAGQYVK